MNAGKQISQPGMIPLDAVRHEPIFFFGTLMHDKVLETVLDRAVAVPELTPATLPGVRRMKASDAVYPVLVEDPGAVTEGLLLVPQTLRDLVRINHFEEDEYLASRVLVQTQDGNIHAWAFIGMDHMNASDIPWELDKWAKAELQAFLPRCLEWMADSPL